MENACSSHISYGDRTLPLANLRRLSCITRTAAVRSPYGDRTMTVRRPYDALIVFKNNPGTTVRPPYGRRTMLRLSYQNRTVTVCQPYGDRTMPFDIFCIKNILLTFQSRFKRKQNTCNAIFKYGFLNGQHMPQSQMPYGDRTAPHGVKFYKIVRSLYNFYGNRTVAVAFFYTSYDASGGFNTES